MDAITVEGLVVEYRKWLKPPIRAVDGLSFTVAPGEVVGFLGTNGAGKTSTIKAMMGFQPTQTGTLSLFGMPAGNVKARGKIGFLPETAQYSPYLTPFETLRLYGQLHGMSKKQFFPKIDELLQMFGIFDKAKSLNKNLSKGMLQRVGIAQALLAEPELLILDEMSSGLDPIGRRELREIMKAQNARGTTIFFSSHELTEVESLCNRIIVVNKGKLVALESVRDLMARIDSLEDYFVDLVADKSPQKVAA